MYFVLKGHLICYQSFPSHLQNQNQNQNQNPHSRMISMEPATPIPTPPTFASNKQTRLTATSALLMDLLTRSSSSTTTDTATAVVTAADAAVADGGGAKTASSSSSSRRYSLSDGEGSTRKHLKKDDYFGEKGFLTCSVSGVTVQTLRACDLFSLQSEIFLELVKKYPIFQQAYDICLEAYQQMLTETSSSASATNQQIIRNETTWSKILFRIVQRYQHPNRNVHMDDLTDDDEDGKEEEEEKEDASDVDDDENENDNEEDEDETNTETSIVMRVLLSELKTPKACFDAFKMLLQMIVPQGILYDFHHQGVGQQQKKEKHDTIAMAMADIQTPPPLPSVAIATDSTIHYTSFCFPPNGDENKLETMKEEEVEQQQTD
jgi:hypothetical protein